MPEHHSRYGSDKAAKPEPPTSDDLSKIALAAAKEASRQTMVGMFAMLGVNIDNVEDMKTLRSNIEFVQRLRSGSNKLGLAAVTALAGAVGIGVWEYIKNLFHLSH